MCYYDSIDSSVIYFNLEKLVLCRSTVRAHAGATIASAWD